MKFDVIKKHTWSDTKGQTYFTVRPGVHETNDPTEIELLKGSPNVKLRSKKHNKASESIKEDGSERAAL